MDKKITATGALLGFLAIVFGAFGAHALKKVLTVDLLAAFETGVRYQMYNALFLLFLGKFDLVSERSKKIVYNLVLWGIVLFSGSLYTISLLSVADIQVRLVGILTPFGGLLLIMGWFWLFIEIIRKKS
ncbi:MAG: hypothetical protein CFE23_06420 [Flavobacterium sp. BFFFF1]|uniref:DUF423 domain-containing protein n=1 Tax=unclassified Flavobacterium TaxID=196869 RepID=UPI000BD083B5|nr:MULTISPECIES: DUF423 domain-containing protein [unclassified Flavobacterium]OYU81121.1 MAG: hypothetical protein CFE23_06420 [Flavobacterium sp. BFFFF1]